MYPPNHTRTHNHHRVRIHLEHHNPKLCENVTESYVYCDGNGGDGGGKHEIYFVLISQKMSFQDEIVSKVIPIKSASVCVVQQHDGICQFY